MTDKQALELIKQEVFTALSMANKARPSQKQALKQKYNQWQSCLEVAEEIYHSGASDSLERILALKLHVKLQK